MSGVTGGALANGTLFALGIGPYINAPIIVQLLTVGIPALERLSKQGEEGRKKITNITRIITIVLAVIQAIGIIVNFAGGFQDMASSEDIRWDLFFDLQWLAIVYMTVIYTAGAMLVMWLGERITEYGVGNGISLIIFVGIISTAGDSILKSSSVSTRTTSRPSSKSSASSCSRSSCSSASSLSTLRSARSPCSTQSRCAAPRCTAASRPSSP